MAKSNNWQIKFHTLKVGDAQEESLFSNGDEPYFVFFGFRSRIKTSGSTQAFWSNFLDDDWADGVDDGAQKAIPAQMGTLTFPNVIQVNANEVLSGTQMPEVVGFVAIAIESDGTPFGSIRSLMNDVRNAISVQVKKLVEDGQLDPKNPGPAIQRAIQEVQNSLNLSTWEKIKLFLVSFTDPDDVIGIQAKVLLAGDPSLKPFVAAEFLEEKELQLTFSSDGATYQASGSITIIPPHDEGDRYLGVFEQSPTKAAWVSRHGLNNAQYQAVFDDLIPKGYRPIALSGYSVNGQDRYMGIWEKSTGAPAVARHSLNGAQYQALFNDLVPKGYRPVILSGYSVNGQDRYLCVFEQSPAKGAWVAHHGLNSTQYQAVFNDLTPKGYRPVILSGYSVNGQDHYMGVWEVSTGAPFVARHGLNSAQYQTVFNDLISKGYRPVILDGYGVNGQDLYLCVFEQSPAKGVWVARHGLSSEQYQAVFNDLVSKGYRLVILSGYSKNG